jgi:hypothetical protein
MFEEISENHGLNHIKEIILIKLDLKSLLRCQLVCKGLYQFIKSLEKSKKLKENDFKMIRRICRKKLLIHSNWNSAFNSIREEDNFYRRRGLIELLETYANQDEIIQFSNQILTNSYLNTSKFLVAHAIIVVCCHRLSCTPSQLYNMQRCHAAILGYYNTGNAAMLAFLA